MAEQLDVAFDIGASGSTYKEKYGFFDKENYAFRSKKGLSHEVVEEISWMKNEPDWMREFRHRSLDIFYKKPMPQWGGNLNTINFDDIYYFVRASEKQGRNWDEVPTDIKNTFDKLGIPEAEQKFLSGVGAQYECLSGDARVFTARGLVPIKEVIPTDVVFSFDETTNQLAPAMVKATAAKGERQVYQVRVGTRSIKATENHPFLVLEYKRGLGKLRGRYQRTWKYLRELEQGDLVAVAKEIPDVGVTAGLAQPKIKTTVTGRNQSVEYPLDISNRYNPISLPDVSSPDLMWWLGLYIGDGFIHHTTGADKARVAFAIPATDQPLRQEFARVTEQLFELPAVNGDPQRMTIYSTILARYLEENGFDGDALTKRIPRWVYGLPQEQKLEFLGGYLDADGYVRDHPKNHDLVLTSANKELLLDVRELCAQCGVTTSTIHRFEGKHPFDKDRIMIGYRMELSGDFERIRSRSPQRTSRFGKRKFYHDYSSAHNTSFRSHTNEYIGFAKIDSITPAGVEQVYDIEVDGPHNFVAEGLIVHNSEVVYHSIKESLTKQGVIFCDTDTALKEYPDLFKKYFGTIIPPADNKFSALNSAVWSGGSFIFVPSGVHVDMPLQAYFRINTKNMGQFERTLIIVDEGAFVHYVEGCFLAGARVQTREGIKAIEQIQEGDQVFTHQGRYRRVYHTMQRPYRGNIYNIQYFGDSDQELSVTEEHPLLVVRRERAHERNKQFSPEWLTAADVKPGDYLAIPVPQPEPNFDSSRTVTIPFGRGRHEPVMRDVILPMEPDFFRLLGYYYTEGHVDAEHYLSFSFHADETEYLDDVRSLVTQYFGKAPIENKPRQNGQTLVLCSTEIARTFAREFGSTVYDKHVPEYVRNAPLDLLSEWVRAMWRGDGSYDARKNMFRFNSVSRDVAYAFRDALLRLGVVASVNLQERVLPRQPMHTVVISSPCNSRFGEMVGQPAPDGNLSGSPFYLDDKYMYVPIRAIDMHYLDTTVYNFSVKEDESYVCEGVVSHNCTAPTYSTDSLHSAVVEIMVMKGGRARYTTIQNWSSNVYNLVTKRTLAKEDATMEWVDANLGCLAEGSLITTPNGVKPIEELNVGDHVLSYDEHAGSLCFRRVEAKRFSGLQPVHTVSVGERKLQVTANHPFFSYKYDADAPKKLGRYQLGYVRADQLKEAIVPRESLDYGTPHRLLKPSLVTQFNSRNQYMDDLVMTRERQPRMTEIEYTTDEMMWLFGYWVGDGDIAKQAGKTEDMIRWAKVGFSTPLTDRAHDRLMQTMTQVIDAPPVVRADGVHVSWHSKELAEFFSVNGFEGNARSKRVPQWVWSLPQSQRLAFIAGYLDADGYAQESRRFAFKSSNRALLEDISSLLVTLGITSRLYTEFDEPKRVTIMGVECIAHGSYRLSMPQDARLLPHLSPSLRQQAEQSRPAMWDYHRSIGRSNIELPEAVEVVEVQVSKPSVETVPTWDIEVEGTGNFVSQGFIVHNSKLTMKYPSIYLMGKGAHGEVLSVAFAGKGQHQDAGGKAVHGAPHTTSQIISKSISKDGGRTSYRGLVQVYPGAVGSKSKVQCDALILDDQSRSDTYPSIDIQEDDVNIGHEASVSKIGEEQLFYLTSRGITDNEASAMIVNGFIEPVAKELPMEYSVELNRLINLQMEGSVG